MICAPHPIALRKRCTIILSGRAPQRTPGEVDDERRLRLERGRRVDVTHTALSWGILGTGRIVEKPVVEDGEIKASSRVALSLTVDHRATDGAPAGRLLQSIKRYMEDPWWMVQSYP